MNTLLDMNMLRATTKILCISSASKNDTAKAIGILAGAKHSFDIVISEQDIHPHAAPAQMAKIRHTLDFVESQDGMSLGMLEMQALSQKNDLVLGVAGFPPYLYPNPDGGWSGVDASVWKVVAEKKRMEIDFKFIPNLVWTVNAVSFESVVILPNITKNPPIYSHLQARELSVDSSAVMLVYSSAWLPGTEISPPLQVREIGLVGSYPGNKDKLLTLLGPFNWQVWLGTICAMFATFLCLVILAYYHGLNVKSMLFPYVYLTWGVSINETIPDRLITLRNFPSNQIILIFWLPLSYLLSLGYQSNLLAALVKVTAKQPIDSYADIMYHDITLYVAKGTLFVHLLSTSPDPLAKETYIKQSVEKGAIYSLGKKGRVSKEIMDDVYNGVGVLDGLRSRLPMVEHQIRWLKDATVGKFHCGYYMSMNNPWLKDVGPIMKLIKDSGMYSKFYEDEAWNLRLAGRTYERTTPAESSWTKLSMGHVLSAALLIIPLGIISSAIFMQEFAAGRKQKRMQEVTEIKASSAKMQDC